MQLGGNMKQTPEMRNETREHADNEKEGQSWRNPGDFPAFSGDSYQTPAKGTNPENPQSHNQSPRFEKFRISELNHFLEHSENLKWLSGQYLGQYQENAQTSGYHLLMKGALDRFVVERLKADPSFTDTEAFQNYARYTVRLARNKVFRPTSNVAYYPEFATNPALKDRQTRHAILTKIYPPDKARAAETTYHRETAHYFQALEFTKQKLESGQKLSQKRMDFVGDYLYQSRNFENPIAKTYAEYIFNKLDHQSQIKPSTPMLGALANYFAASYTEDADVRNNSRIVIANWNGPKHKVNVGASLGDGMGCVMEQNHFLKMSLISDESMTVSRTNRHNDLYRFMMISFHELTHDHQKAAFARGEKSTSAMAHILNQVLRHGQNSCYPKTNSDGTISDTNYYKENHDCDEIEIQADEEAWRQVRAFLVKHEKDYGERHHDQKITQRFWQHRQQCIANESAVRMRRTFTRKVGSTGEQLPYIQFDIENLCYEVAQNGQLIDKYPLLREYVDQAGNLRPSVLFDHRVGKSDTDGYDARNDDFGTEVGTYMLMENREVAHILQTIEQQPLSKNQLDNLKFNLVEILHKNILKSRDLDEIDFQQYQETRSRRDTTIDANDLKNKCFQYFIRQSYNCGRIFEEIKSKYPSQAEDLDNIFSGIEYWYGDFSTRAKLDNDFTQTAIRMYRRYKQNESMSKIANWMERGMGIRR